MTLSDFSFLPKNYQVCLASFIFSISMQFCFHDNSPIYGLVTAIIYHTGTGGSGTSHDIDIAQPHLDFHPGHERAQGLLSKSSGRQAPRRNKKHHWLPPKL